MFKDIKAQIREPEIGRIIAYAAFDGSPEGLAKQADKYEASDTLCFYGWLEKNKIISICGFEVHTDKVEIHLISVAGDKRRQGVGSLMVTALQDMFSLPIEAETDDDAVGFYRKRGFETTAFQHPKWGVTRYTCVLNSPTDRKGIS